MWAGPGRARPIRDAVGPVCSNSRVMASSRVPLTLPVVEGLRLIGAVSARTQRLVDSLQETLGRFLAARVVEGLHRELRGVGGSQHAELAVEQSSSSIEELNGVWCPYLGIGS